jgi:hypothetical protein
MLHPKSDDEPLALQALQRALDGGVLSVIEVSVAVAARLDVVDVGDDVIGRYRFVLLSVTLLGMWKLSNT